jgi:hypothetical protein
MDRMMPTTMSPWSSATAASRPSPSPIAISPSPAAAEDPVDVREDVEGAVMDTIPPYLPEILAAIGDWSLWFQALVRTRSAALPTSRPPCRSGGAPIASINVDALARDVTRVRRAETRHEVRHVRRFPERAERDLDGEGTLTLWRRVKTLIDRCAVNVAGGEARPSDASSA